MDNGLGAVSRCCLGADYERFEARNYLLRANFVTTPWGYEKRRRFRESPAGKHHAMKKWRYAILGWIAWKVIKRKTRRKIPLVDK